MELFKFAKQQGNFLVVGIDSDARVKKNKGSGRPVNSQKDRKFFLECIKYIDKVVIFNNDDELRSCVSIHNIDTMVIGSDWVGKNIIGQDCANRVVFFDRVGEYSTTRILERE